MPEQDPTGFLRQLFSAAVGAADPMSVLASHLPPRPSGRVVVVGAGKASARMAEALEALWGPCEGLVITRYGHSRPTKGIEVIEAAHPVPDQSGVQATARILDILQTCGKGDYVVALISGGASALMLAPIPGLSLADKQALNAALLASGAPIGKMNIVRKHLSRIKAGRLAAAAHPAPLLALMISDVPGDEPAVIGSGPTTGEISRPQDALDILGEYNIPITTELRAAVAAAPPAPAPDDPVLATVKNEVVAAPSISLAAAAQLAHQAGCDVRLLGDDLEGEAAMIAGHHAALAREAAMESANRPILLLSGGELTVTQDGPPRGSGGPNAEYSLAMGIALAGQQRIWSIACDTDGIDGAEPVAGAIVGPDFPALCRQAGRDPQQALSDHDAHGFFKAIGGQVVTGPTLTNVNDFRAQLILPDGHPILD